MIIKRYVQAASEGFINIGLPMLYHGLYKEFHYHYSVEERDYVRDSLKSVKYFL